MSRVKRRHISSIQGNRYLGRTEFLNQSHINLVIHLSLAESDRPGLRVFRPDTLSSRSLGSCVRRVISGEATRTYKEIGNVPTRLRILDKNKTGKKGPRANNREKHRYMRGINAQHLLCRICYGCRKRERERERERERTMFYVQLEEKPNQTLLRLRQLRCWPADHVQHASGSIPQQSIVVQFLSA